MYSRGLQRGVAGKAETFRAAQVERLVPPRAFLAVVSGALTGVSSPASRTPGMEIRPSGGRGAREGLQGLFVPKFFTQVKGVPAGDAKTYMVAWREYRQCLDARSP